MSKARRAGDITKGDVEAVDREARRRGDARDSTLASSTAAAGPYMPIPSGSLAQAIQMGMVAAPPQNAPVVQQIQQAMAGGGGGTPPIPVEPAPPGGGASGPLAAGPGAAPPGRSSTSANPRSPISVGALPGPRDILGAGGLLGNDAARLLSEAMPTLGVGGEMRTPMYDRVTQRVADREIRSLRNLSDYGGLSNARTVQLAEAMNTRDAPDRRRAARDAAISAAQKAAEKRLTSLQDGYLSAHYDMYKKQVEQAEDRRTRLLVQDTSDSGAMKRKQADLEYKRERDMADRQLAYAKEQAAGVNAIAGEKDKEKARLRFLTDANHGAPSYANVVDDARYVMRNVKDIIDVMPELTLNPRGNLTGLLTKNFWGSPARETWDRATNALAVQGAARIKDGNPNQKQFWMGVESTMNKSVGDREAAIKALSSVVETGAASMETQLENLYQIDREIPGAVADGLIEDYEAQIFEARATAKYLNQQLEDRLPGGRVNPRPELTLEQFIEQERQNALASEGEGP